MLVECSKVSWGAPTYAFSCKSVFSPFLALWCTGFLRVLENVGSPWIWEVCFQGLKCAGILDVLENPWISLYFSLTFLHISQTIIWDAVNVACGTRNVPMLKDLRMAVSSGRNQHHAFLIMIIYGPLRPKTRKSLWETSYWKAPEILIIWRSLTCIDMYCTLHRP